MTMELKYFDKRLFSVFISGSVDSTVFFGRYLYIPIVNSPSSLDFSGDGFVENTAEMISFEIFPSNHCWVKDDADNQ